MFFIVTQHSKTFKKDTLFYVVFIDAFVDACTTENLIEEITYFDNDGTCRN